MRDKIRILEVEKLLKSKRIQFEKKRLYTGAELVVKIDGKKVQLVSQLQLDSETHFYFDSKAVADFFIEMGVRAGSQAEKAMELFDVPEYQAKHGWIRPDPKGKPGEGSKPPNKPLPPEPTGELPPDPRGELPPDPKSEPPPDPKGEPGEGSKPPDKQLPPEPTHHGK